MLFHGGVLDGASGPGWLSSSAIDPSLGIAFATECVVHISICCINYVPHNDAAASMCRCFSFDDFVSCHVGYSGLVCCDD